MSACPAPRSLALISGTGQGGARWTRTELRATAISSLLIDVLDAVLYPDRKQILDVDGVRLYRSETHMLVLAVDRASFTEMARHFGVSKGAVSQVLARLTVKGIVAVDKDRSRRNAARVTLPPPA